MMKISEHDKKLLLYVSGILLMILSVSLVFLPQRSKSEDLKFQISEKENELARLADLAAQNRDYEAEKLEIEQEQQTILARFPGRLEEEDVLLHAADVERNSDMSINDVSILPPELFWTEGNSRYYLYQILADYSFTASYDNLKQVLNGFTEEQDRKALQNIDLAYDSVTGELLGTLSLAMYYIDGADKEYVPQEIPGVSVGTDNIFGTLSEVRDEEEGE